MAWKSYSRKCPYCGKSGPRTPIPGGWAHKRCLPPITPPAGVALPAQPGQHTHADPRLDRAQRATDAKFSSAAAGVAPSDSEGSALEGVAASLKQPAEHDEPECWMKRNGYSCACAFCAPPVEEP